MSNVISSHQSRHVYGRDLIPPPLRFAEAPLVKEVEAPPSSSCIIQTARKVGRCLVNFTNSKPIVMGAEATGFVSDGLDFQRNISLVCNPTDATQGDSRITSVFAVMGLLMSVRELDKALNEIHETQHDRDLEGQQRAQGRALVAVISIFSAMAYFVGKLSEIMHQTILTSAMAATATLGFAIGSFISATMLALGFTRCYLFGVDLAAAKEKGNDPRERMVSALSFLEDAAGATQGLSHKEVRAKAKYFKRRSSSKAYNAVKSELAKLLEELKNPQIETDRQKICLEKGEKLIQLVESQVRLKFLLCFIGFIASLAAFSGSVLAFTTGSGVVAYALYAIASGLSLTNSLSLFYALFYGKGNDLREGIILGAEPLVI